MEQLIKDTTAYKIFSGDIKSGKVSHAYMLHFQDAKNMRAVLKLFAAEFFRADKFSPLGQRILNENYPDLRVYPKEDKKFNADAAAEIVEDSAMRPVEGPKKAVPFKRVRASNRAGAEQAFENAGRTA